MMTRVSSAKSVDANHWVGRLAQARDFRKSAEDAVTLASEGQNMNPAVSLMVSAAIAYSDALTAQRVGKVNQQDHAAAPKLLRDALGNALPDAQEKRLRKILGPKDEVQYGIRSTGLMKATSYLDDLQQFGDWVEDQLPSPGVPR